MMMRAKGVDEYDDKEEQEEEDVEKVPERELILEN